MEKKVGVGYEDHKGHKWVVLWSVYDKDHMSELQIKDRSERDLHSCEVT